MFSDFTSILTATNRSYFELKILKTEVLSQQKIRHYTRFQKGSHQGLCTVMLATNKRAPPSKSQKEQFLFAIAHLQTQDKDDHQSNNLLLINLFADK